MPYIALLLTLTLSANPQSAPESPASWASRHYDEALKLVFSDPFTGQAIASQWLWGLSGWIMGNGSEIQVIAKQPFGARGSIEAYYLASGLQQQLQKIRAQSSSVSVKAAAARIEKRRCGPFADPGAITRLQRFSKLSFSVALGQTIRLDEPTYTISVYGPMNTIRLDVGDAQADGVSELTEWLANVVSLLRQRCTDIPDIQLTRHR